MELLCCHGADTNKVDNDRKTPIYAAACWWLLLMSAPWEQSNPITALWKIDQLNCFCCQVLAQLKNLELLCCHGADTNKVDNDCKTPIYAAACWWLLFISAPWEQSIPTTALWKVDQLSCICCRSHRCSPALSSCMNTYALRSVHNGM